MTLLVNPARANVLGGPTLTMAGTAVDVSAGQDPLTGSVSALWSDASTGSGSVGIAASGEGYAFVASGSDLAALESVEQTSAVDVEVDSENVVLGLETATTALSIEWPYLRVDGEPPVRLTEAPVVGIPRLTLRLQRGPDGVVYVWANGSILARVGWTNADAQIVLYVVGQNGSVTRYVRRPVVLVGGVMATDLDVRGGAHVLVGSPPRTVDGPAVGDVVAYALAGAVETLAGAITYDSSPEMIRSGALRLEGGS